MNSPIDDLVAGDARRRAAASLQRLALTSLESSHEDAEMDEEDEQEPEAQIRGRGAHVDSVGAGQHAEDDEEEEEEEEEDRDDEEAEGEVGDDEGTTAAEGKPKRTGLENVGEANRRQRVFRDVVSSDVHDPPRQSRPLQQVRTSVYVWLVRLGCSDLMVHAI